MNRDQLLEIAASMAGGTLTPGINLSPAAAPVIANNIIVCYNALLMAHAKIPERGEAKPD